LLTATILEIAAYYIPWLDNLLDSIATPAAVVAGTLIMSVVNTAPVITDTSPLLKWSLALIAGGGTAGLIQSTTVALRGASSLTTAGLANFALASTELAASLTTTISSLFLPVLTALAITLHLLTLLTLVWRLHRPHPASRLPSEQ
jgi:hypothetical protein